MHINYIPSLGITLYPLRNEVCRNVDAGAYFLALAFNKWRHAGFKNNETPNQRKWIYAKKINEVYRKIKI